MSRSEELLEKILQEQKSANLSNGGMIIYSGESLPEGKIARRILLGDVTEFVSMKSPFVGLEQLFMVELGGVVDLAGLPLDLEFTEITLANNTHPIFVWFK